jgi:hypothetical protein
MTAPDFYAMTVRHVHNLPDDWQPMICRAIDRNLGFELSGAVPIGAYSRGPRKGRPKWPPRKQLQTVVITHNEMRQEKIRWEHETGLCSACGGSGQTVASISIHSPTTYRECSACGGTGAAMHRTGRHTHDS